MVRLLGLFLFLSASLSAAHFENLIDLFIKVEDAAYNFRVTALRFNGEEIPLDESDIFKPRKSLQYKLQPGRYMLNWTTEKSTVRWQDEPIKEHERILVLESGDHQVRISIKGDSISLN